MGNNQRLRGYLQRAEHRLGVGVSEVHQYPQAIALLHDFCTKGRQAAKVSGRRDHIAQRRHHVVSLVKQLQVPHSALVHLLQALQASLDELCSFDRLDDGWLVTMVCRLNVFQCQCAVDMPLHQLCVDRREPAKVVVSRLAGLFGRREIEHKARTNGRKP
jgi:hypothetical protein